MPLRSLSGKSSGASKPGIVHLQRLMAGINKETITKPATFRPGTYVGVDDMAAVLTKDKLLYATNLPPPTEARARTEG